MMDIMSRRLREVAEDIWRSRWCQSCAESDLLSRSAGMSSGSTGQAVAIPVSFVQFISTHPDVYSEDIRIGHAETVDKILKWLEREFLWVYECLASLSLKPLPSCLSWKDPTTISGKSVCDAGCQPNSLPSIFLSYFSFVDSNGQNDFDTKSHVRSHNNSSCLCRFTQFTLLLYSRLLLTLLRNQSWVNLKVWHWESVNPLGKQRSRCLGPKRKPVCKCEEHMKTQSSSASVQGPWKRYQLCYGWRGANSIGNHL